jgi:hypothetical protein
MLPSCGAAAGSASGLSMAFPVDASESFPNCAYPNRLLVAFFTIKTKQETPTRQLLNVGKVCIDCGTGVSAGH